MKHKSFMLAAEGEQQAQWVSVTHASLTARSVGSEEGTGGAVWQWLKPEAVASNKAAPGGGGGGTTRAQELADWRAALRAHGTHGLRARHQRLGGARVRRHLRHPEASPRCLPPQHKYHIY